LPLSDFPSNNFSGVAGKFANRFSFLASDIVSYVISIKSGNVSAPFTESTHGDGMFLTFSVLFNL